MQKSGVPKLSSHRRREDPYYAHFPALKTHLKDCSHGRRSNQLRAIASSNIFAEWDTVMRYAPTADISEKKVEAWRDAARNLIEKMDEY